MKEGDTYEAAKKAVAKFEDERVQHFYDSRQAAGRAFARSLGYADNIVWDFYLFYPLQSEWADLPPQPEIYMHQLRNRWADQARLFEKDALAEKFSETMQSMFP